MFLGILVKAAVCDIRKRRIPDKYCLMIAVLGVLRIPLADGAEAPERFLGAIVVSLPMLVLSAMTGGSFGGGDIKLMAAGGLFLGVERILQAFVIRLLAAGIYCICLLMRRRGNLKSEFALGPFLSLGMAAAVFIS